MTGPAPRWPHLCSGGPCEERYGYCRAVHVGEPTRVSGCTSVVDGQVRHPGDGAAQRRVALLSAVEAVTALGGSVCDVVRTRMYLARRADCEPAGVGHGEHFGQVRAAATMAVAVAAGLIEAAMLVEIELEAAAGTAGTGGAGGGGR